MPLLLAIEPDTRQASLIAGLAKDSLRAELVVASSAREALAALGDRVPDLILTSQLLSPRDESVLTDRLRELDGAGRQVQTLVIPVLAEPSTEPNQRNGLLARFGWRRPKGSTPDGCDPAVFAGQITEYLKRAVPDRMFVRPPASSRPIEDATANVFVHVPASSVPVEGATMNVSAHVPTSSLPDNRPASNVFAHLPASSLLVQDPKPSVSDEEPVQLQPAAPPPEGLSSDEPAAMFAAVPLQTPEFIRTPEIESRIEPRPAPFAVRSDLFEILAAIQHDLEPLRIDTSKTARKASSAVQDEWGFFDPNDCGIAALLTRLEQTAAASRSAT